MLTQGSRSADAHIPRASSAIAALGGCERAVYDPQARAYYDAETGALLADEAAWERAGEDQRDKARARLAAVRRAEDLIARGMQRCEADATAAKEAGIASGVLGRWRRKVRGLPKGARVAALLDARRPGRPSLIDAEMQETLEALLFGLGDHLTAVHAHRTLLTRHGRAPKVQTVRAWLRRWRRENARVLLAVTNPDLDRSRHKPAGGDAAAGVLRLNQLWELDSTPADVICADGKRYAIVAAIDIWSRQARVLVVPASRATAIAALLRCCILEWGVPEAVRTDEGKDYTSRHVLSVLADLEIEHRPCPPYTPEAKPFVERFLGTLTRDLFATLPGFTGHDVAQAQALRSRKSYSARRGEDDAAVYGAELTAEELQERCDAWCDAVYGRRPHSGLGGTSPFARRASWPHPARRIHDERALDALLAEPAGGGWRTVRKAGIRLDNADYIAGELGPLVGERVHIRRDPADPDRIFVYRKDGTFVCVAEDPGRTGADRAAIAAHMTASYKASRKAARKRAHDLMKSQKPGDTMDQVLAHAGIEIGCVVALPSQGKEYQTPALTQAGRAAKAADKKNKAAASPRHTATSASLAAAGALFLKDGE